MLAVREGGGRGSEGRGCEREGEGGEISKEQLQTNTALLTLVGIVL